MFFVRVLPLLLLCGTTSLFANDTIPVRLASEVFEKGILTVDVPVYATSNRRILAFQTGLKWLGEEMAFDSLIPGPAFANGISLSNLAPGRMRVVYAPFQVEEIDLGTDSLLFTLRFDILPGFSGNTYVSQNELIMSLFTDQDIDDIPAAIIPSYVSYGPPAFTTSFGEPNSGRSTATPVCLDLIVKEMSAIAGFDLDLNWDTSRFTLESVNLTQNSVLRQEDFVYDATSLRFYRDPGAEIRTPAVLEATPQAELCFRANAPGDVSRLAFVSPENGGIFGYDTTGVTVSVPSTGLGEGSLEQSGTTAVFGPATHPALKLYPNPGDGRLRIEPLPGVHSLKVVAWNESGQLVHRSILNGTELDLSHLPAGKYLMRTVAAGKTYVNRLLITK